MLMLFALPSLGITTAASRSLLGSERQAESEELEEHASCCCQRRVQLPRSLDSVSFLVLPAGANFQYTLAISRPLFIIGHRISSDLLAPLRC